MKVIISFAIVILAFVMVFGETGNHKFVGVDKCKTCHKLAKYGDQNAIWEKSKHANAYATLASEESKKIAKEMGIDDPQKSEKCLTCHVTAYGVADEMKEASFKMEEGVGCEACHGAGADYKKMSIMKNREKAVAAGLLIPDEKTCLNCHNEKSPTYKPFKYEERYKEIAHPKPAAK